MKIETNYSLNEEEPLIFYYSTLSNFGVQSKNIKSPKDLFISSFTPLSSSQEISFSNTIMLPFITTESSIEQNEKEKSKTSLMRKDNTRIKTESSSKEKVNLSEDKQITKILIDNNNESKIKEDISLKQDENNLEKNPFFLGNKLSLDLYKYQTQTINEEQKKVKKLLNKNIIDKNLYYQTSKNLINKINVNNFENVRKTGKRRTKVKRMRSFNNLKGKEENQEKEKDKDKESEKKNSRKNRKKHNTCMNNQASLFKSVRVKVRNSDKKITQQKESKNGLKLNRKGRESTILVNKSPFLKFKDNNNIKVFQANLFNQTSSTKIKLTKNINEDKENQKYKEKKRKKNASQNSLKLYKNIETNDTPILKGKKEIFPKKEEQIETEQKIEENDERMNFNLKSSKRKHSKSLMIKKFRKLKTFNKEIEQDTKQKIPTTVKKKYSETRKNLDFDKAIKNVKNKKNTQYNLFSPDKFTNTEFSDSDYCEYTLECMDLILNQNRSQKQQKPKINFNFPKNKNKIKKKIALFDLDETLVHCTGELNNDMNSQNNETYQHSIDIILPGNKEVKVGINIRPYWKKTLRLIRKYYNIVVFTASHQAYADAVLDFMDPNKKYFKYRLYRNNCSLVDVDGTKFYVKDLDIFDESYDLKDIVIIDNSVLSFIYHLENGIPIVPYYNEDKDSSLYVVGLYLMHIYKENDLRKANKKYINLDSFLNEARIKKNINDEQTIINEESFSIENNENNPSNESSKKEPQLINISGINNTKNDNDNNKNIKKQSRKTSEHNIKRCSFNSKNEAQNKLMSKSKLIKMFYEINDKSGSIQKSKDIIDEKSNKSSCSSDDEKIIDDNNKSGDLFFFSKRLLTDNKTRVIPKKNKSSKTCNNYLDLNMIKSNFYNNFSKDNSLIK